MVEEVKIPSVDGKSMDITAAEKEKLKAVFPQCFTEGKLDIDKLLSLCGEYIDNDFEKYKFEWKGKSECYRIAGKRSTGTLRPCPEESVDFDKTNNLYIEGDNLEVLKLLQTAYYRKVKMIYIDPPYNTGNDFVYEDDFKDPLAKYKEVTSQTTKSNPETMGRYHTNWLNMMYPRLRLAANLLRDDGVIFISIDDNEVTNLRRLCDEVFGEENCLGQLVWSLSSGPQAGHFTRAHEYILAYTKNKEALGWFEDKTGGVISHGALKKISSANPASDVTFPKGSICCEISNITFPVELGESEKEFITKGQLSFRDNLLAEDVTIRAGWAMKNQLLSWLEGKETYDSKGQKVVRFYFNAKGILFYEKERGTTHPKTVLTPDIVGNTKKGTDCIIDLFQNKVMDFPKPVELISFLVNLVTKDSDIVLDFFSGSATTAHAVMQLNAEDGGNRQFIMVQLPEITDEKSEAFKAGYKNICEIGKERIRRAGKKILEKYSKTPSPLRGEGRDEGDKLNLLPFAKEMRHNPTDAEQKLWYAMHNNQLGYKFRRQQQIGNYIVDFVCLNKKLIIECDGGQHNENVDKNRTAFLNKEGYKVLRFWNNEILSNIDGVLYKIKDVLDNTPHPNPLPQGARESASALPQGARETASALPQGARESASAIPQGARELDVGFKVFKLDTSNLVKWDDTPTDNTEVLKERFDTVVKTLKFDCSELDVVYEVMLKLGIPLTYSVNEITVNTRKVYSIGDDGLVLVCLDRSNNGITPEDVSAMCDLAPAKIVAAEEAFKDDIALSNAFYISKDKGIEIELL